MKPQAFFLAGTNDERNFRKEMKHDWSVKRDDEVAQM